MNDRNYEVAAAGAVRREQRRELEDAFNLLRSYVADDRRRADAGENGPPWDEDDVDRVFRAERALSVLERDLRP